MTVNRLKTAVRDSGDRPAPAQTRSLPYLAVDHIGLIEVKPGQIWIGTTCIVCGVDAEGAPGLLPPCYPVGRN